MELILLVATIAQQWRLRLVPGHPVVPQPLVTLRAKHGMRMTIAPVLDRKCTERDRQRIVATW